MDLKEKIKNALPELKKILFGEEQKIFKEAKTADGTVIRYQGETPMKGSPITVITEQGELPVPSGEVKLEDGTVILVEDGVIVEVKAAEPAAEEAAPEQEMAQPDAKELSPEIRKVIESTVKETVFALQSTIDNQAKTIESQSKEISDIKEFSKQMLSVVEAMGDTPESNHVEAPKKQSMKEFAQFLKDSRQGRKELRKY